MALVTACFSLVNTIYPTILELKTGFDALKYSFNIDSPRELLTWHALNKNLWAILEYLSLESKYEIPFKLFYNLFMFASLLSNSVKSSICLESESCYKVPTRLVISSGID